MKTNKNKVNYAISNVDIAMYLDNPNIVKYSDLVNFDSIDSLFDGYSYVILLIESGRNKGHWVSLLRYNNCIEQFDSYGSTIDNELKYISEKNKEKLGETDHFLTNLLKKSKYEIIVNEHKFQSESEGIDTCGKFVLLRILMFLCADLRLPEFVEFVKKGAKKLKVNNDGFVCRLIMF